MEQNKQRTQDLFARLTAKDIDGVMALLADDVVWHIAGEPARMPTAGRHDKAQLRRLFERMLAGLQEGLKMSVERLIAEGDAVAAEVQSRGELKNGRSYHQHYHFALEFRAGKITSVREYLDTQHAYDVWFRP